MDRRALFEQAASRHGVVTPPDVRDAGVHPSSFEAWRDRDRLARPHHAVTVLPGFDSTPSQRLAIAVAGIGPPCAVTGWGAAHLFGLRTTVPTVIDVLVPHGTSPREHTNVRVQETSTFPSRDLRLVDGIPVPPPARWLADLSREVDLDVLAAMAIDLRGRRELRQGDLDRELGQRKRFPGRGRFRTLTDMLREDGSDSGFELRARGRLEDRGTPPDAGQLDVVVARRNRRIDLPFRGARAGVECRGFAYHGRDAFDRDAERHNDFVEDGTWCLLELTWTMFLFHWDAFCARLDRVLAART